MAAFRRLGVSPSGFGPDGMRVSFYLRDPSASPGFPVLVFLTFLRLQIAVGNMIYSPATDGGDV